MPRVVHTTHGLYATPDDRLAKRVVVYSLEAVASRFSHVELVQNPEDLELMRRLADRAARKLRLLGNGVDLEPVPARDPDAETQVRAELGLADRRRGRRPRRPARGGEGRAGAGRRRRRSSARRSDCC